MKDINRLDFSNAKLYGRSKELATLRDAYERVSAGKSETILVTGTSGTGKSTLIIKALQHDAYFVTGKFDQQRISEPYSGISMAFAELCKSILSSSNTNNHQVITNIKETLNTKEIRLLCGVIPDLRKIVGNVGNELLTPRTGAITTKETINQLTFAFQTFVRCVCTQPAPLILFVDDLQWADCPSMQLIKALVTDTDSKYLLLVGSYRDDEVDDNHLLLREIENDTSVQRIGLSALDDNSINEFISDLTGLSTSTTRPLTDIVFQKTLGNIFFVIQFLRTMQEEEMLYFSFSTYKWAYDIERVQSESDVTDNVVDFVTKKIQKQNQNVQSVLKIAASVSFIFSVDFLIDLITKGEKSAACVNDRSCLRNPAIHDAISQDKKDLIILLDKAVDEGLLEKLGESSGDYKFAHDRVQQAAYAMMDPLDRDKLHLHIGELLWRTGAFEENSKLLFCTADQLNRGSAYITSKDYRCELAKLNLKAGERAMSLSAFVPAASFLEAGIAMLDNNTKWEAGYEDCLRLHTCLADAASAVGDFQTSDEMIKEVLENARSLDDKLPSYYTLINSLIAQGKLDDSMDLICDVLNQLGEPCPKKVKPFHVAKALKKVERALQGLSDDDILALPLMEDKKMLAVMTLFAQMTLSLWMIDCKNTAIYVSCRVLEIMLRFGICDRTADCLGFYGTTLVTQGNIHEAYRFGRLSIEMGKRNEHEEWLMSAGTYVSVLHWKDPLQNMVEPLMNGYHRMMEAGCTDRAFLWINAYLSIYFYSGLPLEPIITDFENFGLQMINYKQQMSFCLLLPVWQCTLNLTGRSNDPLEMESGEAINKLRLVENKHNIGMDSVRSFKMQLSYYFGHYEVAHKLAKKLKDVTEDESNFIICVRTFFFGLISLALARKTKKRKYLAEARTIIKKMKRWVESGAINLVHKLILLEAEYASLVGHNNTTTTVKDMYHAAIQAVHRNETLHLTKKDSTNTEQVRRMYDNAIKIAAQSGYNQDVALANELAGKYLIEGNNNVDDGRGSPDDDFWPSFYICRSYESYIEWGAVAKANSLQEEYPTLITPSNKEKYRSSVLGRSRFDPKDVLMHKGHKLMLSTRLQTTHRER